MELNFDIWRERLFTSVSNLSRTSKGATNKAYVEKPSLLITDPALLRRQTAQNLRLAISHVWIRGPLVKAEKMDVRLFIDTLAARISEELLPPDRRVRTWELDKKKYPEGLSPHELPLWLPVFYKSVAVILADTGRDPVQSAAWIERVFDARLHPLVDGCGRVAKLLGAWILLCGEKYPAYFCDRDEYYSAMMSSVQIWENFYRAHVSS